jgi:hypothetical protein
MMAQALFDDGRQLMEAKRYEQACAKFEESNRLDPAMGTQFHLADCYELIGRRASAWILFIDVAAAARAGQQPGREKAARARAAVLLARLTKLKLDVTKPVDGMTVLRNGHDVPRPQWGTAAPVEPGKYRIEASAPGHRPWSRDVTASGEGTTVRVTVPPLERMLAQNDEATGDGLSSRRVAAIVMGAAGLLGVAAGVAAGIVAIDKKDQSEAHCPQENACFDKGLELRDEGRQAAAASTVSFAVGGAALVGALILWLTGGSTAVAPSDSAGGWQLRPLAGPRTLGLQTSLRW